MSAPDVKEINASRRIRLDFRRVRHLHGSAIVQYDIIAISSPGFVTLLVKARPHVSRSCFHGHQR